MHDNMTTDDYFPKRKTAKQKREEAEAARMEEERLGDMLFLADYLVRLLTLIHAYVHEQPNSLQSTGEAEYKAFEFRTSRYNSVRLPLLPESDPRSVSQLREDMEEAEGFLETSRENERKARKLATKKSAALAKLSKEERELLGL